MPLITLPGFCGPSNVVLSLNADAEDTINLYLSGTAPGSGKIGAFLTNTPGLNVSQVLGDSPVRGLFSQDGRAFAVAGHSFYELNTPTSATYFGAVASDTNMATFATNGSAGHQLAISSGGLFYIFDLIANTLTPVTTGLEPITMVEFMDGYFLANTTSTRRFGWSALEDGTSWDALDIAERSIASDNIVAMIRSHRDLFLLGSLTSEVWYDQGDALNPFAPYGDVFIEQGCDSAFSAQRIDNTIMWKGQNVDGYGVIWKANGFTPQRISTDAIELLTQQFGSADDRAWVYQEDGHLFYVLVMPTQPASGDLQSPTYDAATGVWHKRARWDSTNCVWVPVIAQCHCLFQQTHLVGDRVSGAIYQQSLSIFDEQIVA